MIEQLPPQRSIPIEQLLDESSEPYRGMAELATRIYDQTVYGQFYGAIDNFPMDGGLDFQGHQIRNGTQLGIGSFMYFAQGERWQARQYYPPAGTFIPPTDPGYEGVGERLVQVAPFVGEVETTTYPTVAVQGLFRRRKQPPAAPVITTGPRVVRGPGRSIDLSEAATKQRELVRLQLAASRKGRGGSELQFDMVVPTSLADEVLAHVSDTPQKFDMLFNALLPGAVYSPDPNKRTAFLHDATALRIKDTRQHQHAERTQQMVPEIIYPSSNTSI